MDVDRITEAVIGCAIEVHKTIGPGLLESLYEEALCIELDSRKIRYSRQIALPVTYRSRVIGDYRIDLLIENCVVVELKSTERHNPVFEAQLLSYMRLGDFPIGLLINFNNRLLKQGIKRFRL